MMAARKPRKLQLVKPERAAAERDAELRESLKRLRFAFITGPEPTAYERHVMAVASVLAGGDAELTKRMAEVATSTWELQAANAHVDVLERWVERLAVWDERAPGVAERFIIEMVDELRDYAGHVAPEYVMTPERVEAVRAAFETASGKVFDRDPGRKRLSVGLRAMGFAGSVDNLLSNYRKARQK